MGNLESVEGIVKCNNGVPHGSPNSGRSPVEAEAVSAAQVHMDAPTQECTSAHTHIVMCRYVVLSMNPVTRINMPM